MSFAYNYDIYDMEDPSLLKTVKGVLSIEGDELLFEYKLYDMMGTVVSTLNKYSFSVNYLNKVMFKKGLFGSKLLIETTKLVFLEPLPGSSQGKITLRINREDRGSAQEFATKLNIALTERKLKELGDD